MEDRIKCIQCDNTILQQTALRHHGLCKPCFKQLLLNEIACTEFGIAYEDSFKRPPLKTKRYIDCWLDISLTLDGPLYEIRTGGDCQYIFQNKTGIWTDVPDLKSLRDWCLRHISRLRERLLELRARNADEVSDQRFLMERADQLQETVLLAIEFLNKTKPVAKG